MGFSPERAAKWLQDIKDEGSWVSLHFDNPEVAGAYASEIGGSGYIRQKAGFGPISNSTMWVTRAIVWQGLPQSRITYVAGFDAQYNGELQWSSQLAAPARILDGKGYNIAASSIALSIGSA